MVRQARYPTLETSHFSINVIRELGKLLLIKRKPSDPDIHNVSHDFTMFLRILYENTRATKVFFSLFQGFHNDRV